MAAAAVSEGDVIIAGDFNARVAQLCDSDAVIRGCTDTVVPVHYTRLIETLKQSGLLICLARHRVMNWLYRPSKLGAGHKLAGQIMCWSARGYCETLGALR